MVDKIEGRLRRVGACAFGVATADEVPPEVKERYERWLATGQEAGMGYMHNHMDLRCDPRKLLDGCRSVICVAFSYAVGPVRDSRLPVISEYALLPDYHDWVKRRVRESGVGELLGAENQGWRICVDSAPVAERYWAWRAGLGIIGDNGMLIVPGVGSKVILAEILTTAELPAGNPMEGDCGHCGRCHNACPAGALGEEGIIDCNRCLSYLSIEHKGEWEDERHLSVMHTEAGRNTLFGCDRCVSVCPHNRTDARSIETVLDAITGLRAEDIERKVALPKQSCLRRAGRKGLLRNAKNHKSK